MIYLFWIFNFFVVATSDGRFITINYNLDIFFNKYVYLTIVIFYGAYGAINKYGITNKTNFGFFCCGILITLYNIIGYFFRGDINYFYTSLVLLSSYYIGSTSADNIHKFVKYSLFLLFSYTLIKVSTGFLGLGVLPFSDMRYVLVSNDGVFRLSNSILFGQRNAAGAAVASIYILYSSLVYSNYVQCRFYIFLLTLVLVTSAMSATGVIIVLVCYAVTSQIKIPRLLFLVGGCFFAWIVVGGIDRKIESIYLKIGLFFDFFLNIDAQVLLIGSLGSTSRPWVESSMLDMIYDLGIFIPAAVLIHFLIVFVKWGRRPGAGLLYGNFLVMLLLSNSTMQPPMILCLVLTYNILKRRVLI